MEISLEELERWAGRRVEIWEYGRPRRRAVDYTLPKAKKLMRLILTEGGDEAIKDADLFFRHTKNTKLKEAWINESKRCHIVH